jgi:hypothetical protein
LGTGIPAEADDARLRMLPLCSMSLRRPRLPDVPGALVP